MSTDAIFQSYIQMRSNGLEAKDVLKTLRASIDTLPRDAREALALQLRHWERNHLLNAPVSEESTVPIDVSPATVNATWIACPSCGKKNRRQEVFCYSCGHLLQPPSSERSDTRQFADATSQLFTDDYFGEDSVLVLIVRDTSQRFEVRPQLRSYEVVVGRSTDGASISPDVDLSSAQASEMGVSRLHLGIQYDAKANALQVKDLGSANGSYLNGQRLHPREVRILRNGDELRLSKLVLGVYFLHPGEAVP
ncbi:MAG: FHA domain-containing protein [Anaerolineae bacterium]